MYVANLHRVGIYLFGKTVSFDYGSGQRTFIIGSHCDRRSNHDPSMDRQTDGDIDWSWRQIMVELIIRQW